MQSNIIILIVEDDVTLRENTAEFLALEGYTPITAKNGRNALEKIQIQIPDIIISDLLMPEMDGLELLTQLGKNSKLSRTPFIFFSGKTENTHITRGLDMGASKYIKKPFELEDLLRVIECCLKDIKKT